MCMWGQGVDGSALPLPSPPKVGCEGSGPEASFLWLPLSGGGRTQPILRDQATGGSIQIPPTIPVHAPQPPPHMPPASQAAGPFSQRPQMTPSAPARLWPPCQAQRPPPVCPQLTPPPGHAQDPEPSVPSGGRAVAVAWGPCPKIGVQSVWIQGDLQTHQDPRRPLAWICPQSSSRLQ